MMNECWMCTALQKNEAVLLPALQPENPFRPVEEWTEPSVPTLRPCGSMAGRSVLRAAGLSQDPYRRHSTRPVRLRRTSRSF